VGFPEEARKVYCFGFDWLGRIFALDERRLVEGQPGVIMFEPGTGEALEIPANLISFHEHELHVADDAALASSFYNKWITGGGTPPSPAQCIGYKNPLFLGGDDETYNLELSDMSVYWTVMGGLIAHIRGFPLP
jgi:hypothetical protein